MLIAQMHERIRRLNAEDEARVAAATSEANTPIDTEWIVSMGFTTCHGLDYWYRKYFDATENEYEWYEGVFQFNGKNTACKTRGDVRRLLRLMGDA